MGPGLIFSMGLTFSLLPFFSNAAACLVLDSQSDKTQRGHLSPGLDRVRTRGQSTPPVLPYEFVLFLCFIIMFYHIVV